MVVYIIITVMVFMIGFFTVSISYSKAFRVNNSIVNSIERNKDFVEDDINSILRTVGYKIVSNFNYNSCGSDAVNRTGQGNYDYCVYEHEFQRGGQTGKYYSVVTRLYFDVPIFGDMFNFSYPIHGETRVIYRNER